MLLFCIKMYALINKLLNHYLVFTMPLLSVFSSSLTLCMLGNMPFADSVDPLSLICPQICKIGSIDFSVDSESFGSECGGGQANFELHCLHMTCKEGRL